jgi:hypothetical protein
MSNAYILNPLESQCPDSLTLTHARHYDDSRDRGQRQRDPQQALPFYITTCAFITVVKLSTLDG